MDLKQRHYLRKSWFLNKNVTTCDHQWHLKSYFNWITNLSLHNVSIHSNFHQNRSLNTCSWKNKSKSSESRIFLWDIQELTFLIKEISDNGQERDYTLNRFGLQNITFHYRLLDFLFTGGITNNLNLCLV